MNGGREYFIRRRGKEVYAKDTQSSELYPKTGKTFVRDPISGREIYAKYSNGDEFYPDRKDDANKFVKNEAGFYVYAVTEENEILFPHEGGAERYLRSEGHSEYRTLRAASEMGYEVKYARDAWDGEIYPKDSYEGKEIERPVGKSYAKDRLGNSYYPLDGCGHEYFDADVESDFPPAYPITSDNRYILPSDSNGRPRIVKGMEPLDLTEKDVVGKIKQLDFWSFLTDRSSIPLRRSRSVVRPSYVIHEYERPEKSWMGTLLWILVVLLATFCAFYLGFR